MASFRLASIQVLRESKGPLHYDEIARMAIERSLVETSGKTPENTFNAIISSEIKELGEKAAFVRTDRGVYGLNPQYTPEEQAEDETEEHVQEVEQAKYDVSTQYVGTAGEYRVLSELLFRGYNASLLSVDEGIDIIAISEGHQYNIQVKTAHEKYGQYVFDLRRASFERHTVGNTYYVFVLRSSDTNFIVLSYEQVQKNIDEGNILVVNKGTRYRVNIKDWEGDVFVGNLKNSAGYYLNNWDVIR